MNPCGSWTNVPLPTPYWHWEGSKSVGRGDRSLPEVVGTFSAGSSVRMESHHKVPRNSVIAPVDLKNLRVCINIESHRRRSHVDQTFNQERLSRVQPGSDVCSRRRMHDDFKVG